MTGTRIDITRGAFDFLGQRIKTGDHLVYAGHKGATTYLRRMSVEAIVYDEKGWKVTGHDPVTLRRTWMRRIEASVICQPPEEPGTVEVLDFLGRSILPWDHLVYVIYRQRQLTLRRMVVQTIENTDHGWTLFGFNPTAINRRGVWTRNLQACLVCPAPM